MVCKCGGGRTQMRGPGVLEENESLMQLYDNYNNC